MIMLTDPVQPYQPRFVSHSSSLNFLFRPGFEYLILNSTLSKSIQNSRIWREGELASISVSTREKTYSGLASILSLQYNYIHPSLFLPVNLFQLLSFFNLSIVLYPADIVPLYHSLASPALQVPCDSMHVFLLLWLNIMKERRRFSLLGIYEGGGRFYPKIFMLCFFTPK